MSNQSASVRSTPRSLNPELLMREFTQDEQGRIDSLGATDSPSACFQSQFAREVVQVMFYHFILSNDLNVNSTCCSEYEKIQDTFTSEPRPNQYPINGIFVIQ